MLEGMKERHISKIEDTINYRSHHDLYSMGRNITANKTRTCHRWILTLEMLKCEKLNLCILKISQIMCTYITISISKVSF